MHGDHIFGLPGLLASCGMAGTGQQQIDIYGPPDLGKYLEACRRYSKTQSSYPIKVHITEPGTVYEDDDYKVVCQRLKHRIPAHGYRVVEKDRTGHFDVKRAATLGIPPGPVYGKLKRGEVVTLEDGRRINGADLCGPTILGRKFAYCTDTVFCESAIELADQADVLIHEATFSHHDAQLAYQRMHSTSTMAAQVALAAQAKQLIMTHFSPRYAPGNVLELGDLLDEAKAIFPNTLMAKDFFTYDIERHDGKPAKTTTAKDKPTKVKSGRDKPVKKIVAPIK